ncbi:hypothetical protein FBEOM_7382 [Fusarium beomiforme]|uniref:Uncharacterized protein n=1 Tax=Fusarium beomiforme TaxID=44412 RepID=A0A9P5AH66_9HYPO|nr:hypothetical protein FBEOM_7382 [Fusarium beomiforme]
MSVVSDEFKDKALSHFKILYNKRIESNSLQSYHAPHDIPSKLDPLYHIDKKFYQGRFYAEITPENNCDYGLELGAILWEILGTDPEELMVLLDALLSPNDRFWEIWKANCPPFPEDRALKDTNHEISEFKTVIKRIISLDSPLDLVSRASLSGVIRRYERILDLL